MKIKKQIIFTNENFVDWLNTLVKTEVDFTIESPFNRKTYSIHLYFYTNSSIQGLAQVDIIAALDDAISQLPDELLEKIKENLPESCFEQKEIKKILNTPYGIYPKQEFTGEDNER